MQVDHSLQSVHCKQNMYSVYVNPLATLQAYVHKYTWRPYVMTSCPLEQNLCGFKGLVEYSAIVNFQ